MHVRVCVIETVAYPEMAVCSWENRDFYIFLPVDGIGYCRYPVFRQSHVAIVCSEARFGLGVLILLLLQRPDVPDTRMGYGMMTCSFIFVGLFESMQINGNQKLDDLSIFK